MSSRRSVRRAAEGGFALLLVLWWVGLLALLATRATASGREQADLARNLLDRARMEEAADGAVQAAIFRIAAGEWSADGQPHLLATRPLQVDVDVESEDGKIDPNEAPPGLLRALLQALDVPADRAASLAAALTDWHTAGDRKEPLGAKSAEYRSAGLPYGPADAPFTSLDEIRLVLGMTDPIFDALRPHLSIATEGDVDRAHADPIVRTALATFGRNVLPVGLSLGQISEVVRIRASVHGPRDGAFVREAVVRFPRTSDTTLPPFEILSWEAPASGDRAGAGPPSR